MDSEEFCIPIFHFLALSISAYTTTVRTTFTESTSTESSISVLSNLVYPALAIWIAILAFNEEVNRYHLRVENDTTLLKLF